MGLETVDFFHILARDPTSNSYKTGVNVTTAHNQLIATRQELYQNLNKTRELGSLLDKSELQLQTIGERLPHLKKAMAPLLVQAESVKSVSEWIEESMGPAKNLIKKFDEAHLLEKTLIREPREDFEVYLSTVVKLADLLDYLKLNSRVAIKLLKEAMEVLLQEKSVDKYRVRKVNQSLMTLIHHQSVQEKLVTEFKFLMVEHTLPLTLPDHVEKTTDGGRTSPGASALSDEKVQDVILLPAWVLERLHAIIETLQRTGGCEGCLGAFGEIRSNRAFVSLQGLKLNYLKNLSPEAIDRIDWDNLQIMIGLWCQHIEVAVKVLYASERQLARQVLGHLDQDLWTECFVKVASTGMVQFLQFGEGIARSHRAPEKLFKLLDMFETLDQCVPTVNTVFEGDSGLELRARTRELQKLVVSGACQTFWEFKQWVAEQNEGALVQDGSVTRLSSYVVNYLKYLVSEFYSPVMDKVLKIDQNWRGQEQSEEQGLAYGVLLFMQALELQVERRSREFSDPALRHIFMMNNLWYMRTRARRCELGPLLGETWLTEQRQKVQQHALAYEHEVWGHVLHHLNQEGMMGPAGGRGSARELVRQRLSRFTAALEESCARQAHWIVAEDDLREGTKRAVLDAVVPAYRTFIEFYGHVLDSQGAGPKSYLKYLPEDVEKMLKALLMGSRTDLPHNSNSGNHSGPPSRRAPTAR
ncbi:unnamed protein product [Sphagnum jensenii]|uniref:Exocyst subunit Exo70 family protein n=1 Tax=Sphagnum jensenii TaxID=128206 RepID=A0ABP0VNB4_9BRYO